MASTRVAPGTEAAARRDAGETVSQSRVDLNGCTERQDLGKSGDRVVVHADTAMADALTERRRVVVAVNTDLGVTPRESRESIRMRRQPIRERPVHAAWIGCL